MSCFRFAGSPAISIGFLFPLRPHLNETSRQSFALLFQNCKSFHALSTRPPFLNRMKQMSVIHFP
jgi:hypothetical protein